MNTINAQNIEKQSTGKSSVYYIFFGIIGLGLLFYLISEQGIEKLWVGLVNVNYWWSLPILLIAIFNNIIRSLRWQLLLKTMGYRPGLPNAFHALMFGYMVNYAIPRMGEITRCIVLKKNAKIPFQSTLGTVITERLIDVFSLFLVCLFTIFFAYNEIAQFIIEYLLSPFYKNLTYWLQELWLISIILLVTTIIIGIIIWLFKSKFLQLINSKKILYSLIEIWKGVKSVKNVDRPISFIAYSVIIWFNYFMSTYLWFYALNIEPSIKMSLVVMAMGSIAKSLPIQGGGIGAYHFIVAQAVMLFGFTNLLGNTLAIVNHGFQTVYQISFGLVAMLFFARK